jgi:hypothetical protein
LIIYEGTDNVVTFDDNDVISVDVEVKLHSSNLEEASLPSESFLTSGFQFGCKQPLIRYFNEIEEAKAKEERRERIKQYYLRRSRASNSAKSMQKMPLERTISGMSHMSSITCHSIEELELSSQLTNGTMTNLVSGCLHPNWKLN